MKVRVWIMTRKVTSKMEEILDVQEDLGFTEQEWAEMPEEEKEKLMQEIAFRFIDWSYEEIE